MILEPVTTASPRRGRPPKGEPQLSLAAIVEATLQVIDADGVDAVSMRTVGRVLGVDAKSLYNHVSGKEGLLDAVAEHLLRTITFPAPTGELRADLRAIAGEFRNRALAHPQAATLVLTRQLSSLEGLTPVDAVLSVLGDAGFSAPEAVHLLRALLATVIGALLREVHAGAGFGASDAGAISARQADLQDSGLSSVAAAAPHLARFDGDAEFDFGVELALDALSARIAVRNQTPGVASQSR